MASGSNGGKATNAQAIRCSPHVDSGKPRKQPTRAELKREPFQPACSNLQQEQMKQTTAVPKLNDQQDSSYNMGRQLREACKLPELSESPPLSGLSMLKTEDDEIDGLTACILVEARTGATLGCNDFSDIKDLSETMKLEAGERCATFSDAAITSQLTSFSTTSVDTKSLCDYLTSYQEAAEAVSSVERANGDSGGVSGPDRGEKLSQEPGGESKGCTLPGKVKKEVGEVIGETGISSGMVVDADNNCSHADNSAHDILSWPDSAFDFSLESLGGGEVHDLELMDEEALLLADGPAEQEPRQQIDNAGENTGPVSEESFTEASGRQTGDEETGVGGKGSKAASGRRKMKVDWTPELHRRFVQAVEQLGVEKAIPSRILELMGVQCLTRHNIASHLQKYRSHRRHLMAREAEAANWHSRRAVDPSTWSRLRRDGTAWLAPHSNPPPIQPRPAMGMPPLQPHPSPVGHPIPHPCAPPHAAMHPGTPAMGMPLYVWGHPTVDHSPAHMWQQPPVAPPPAWYAPDGSMWQYPVAPPMDAWGHPSSSVSGTPCFPQHMMRLPAAPPVVCGTPAALPVTTAESSNPVSNCIPDNFLNDEALNEPPYAFPDDLDLVIDPNDELLTFADDTSSKSILDEAISKALADPQMPLPLGLKPPSMEKVMAELQKQGIATASCRLSLSTSTSEDTMTTAGVSADPDL